MKIWIDEEERYPVYDISTCSLITDGPVVEIDEETYDKWTRILNDYADLQGQLKKLYDGREK